MASLLLPLLAAGFVQAAPPLPKAPPPDFGEASCEVMDRLNDSERALLAVWVDGWIAGNDGAAQTPGQLSRTIERIADYCDSNPDDTIFSAAKAVLEGGSDGSGGQPSIR
jgi:hypothetical protein